MEARRFLDEGDHFDHRWNFFNPNPRPYSASSQNPALNLQTYTQRLPSLVLNPNPSTDLNLEAAFSRLGLGPSSPDPHLFWENIGAYQDIVGIGSANNIDGFSPYYANLQHHQQELENLNRLRSFSASMGLGLQLSSSASPLVRGLENGGAGRNIIGLDQYNFPSLGLQSGYGGLYPQRRSQSFAELGHGSHYPVRASLYNLTGGVRTNHLAGSLRGCRSRSRSVNGLESSARLLSVSSPQAGLPRSNNSHYPSNNRVFSSLDQVRGRVALVARDQEGGKFLQKLLEEERRPEHVDMIFLEVKDQISELMVDQFANHLVQKLFDFCNDDQITQLLLSLISRSIGHVLPDLCCHIHGTRAMQKMVGRLKTQEQRSLLVSALEHVTVTLTKDQHGHHVIQQCLNQFPPDDNKYLVKEIADHCLEIAMDKSGCCVLQQAAAISQGEMREHLVSEIITNALVLSEDPYGNYVVQFTLGLKLRHATAGIIKQLRGNYVALSMNKYGSNVVERCLRECEDADAAMIIGELMASNHDFLNVLQDQYGNFVAQSALEVAQGDVRRWLVERIQTYSANLHSHLFGKKVLAKARVHRHRV